MGMVLGCGVWGRRRK